ncbi:MAG: N-6 DNA methylase [Candidatus Omnitrophica bacterium]|nr:N-6 DNA methylase [Candidatus Omnitrophota bacterium]
MAESGYISTSDLARILGISRQAVQKMIKKYTEVRIKRIGSSFLYEINSFPEEIKTKILKAQAEAAEKLKSIKPDDYKDLTFEKELWKAANKLRGNIDPSEYKYIILGLIFLKYVSDSFYYQKEELEKLLSDPNSSSFISDVTAREYYLNQKDPYTARGVFYVPEKARWEYLQKFAMSHDIGKYIDKALEEIENANPQLKGILPKVYITTPLESHILGELINIFSKIKFNHEFDKEKDILGRVYEYFLGQFASAEGKRAGQFFTPRSIVKLLVEILEPYEGCRVFDPACGSGGMFVQSAKFLEIHKKDPSKISFYGQELNVNTWKLCMMNLAIRGITGDIRGGKNSLLDDQFPDLRADFVIANPEFNQSEWGADQIDPKDPRVKYGIPPDSNANFMWIQHFIYHLAPNGMAGFVMANGALAVGGKEGEIRKRIIEDDLIDVIIACPPKLFYNVSLPVSLWFITKNKKNGRFRNRTGETLFIDAREIYEPISRRQYTFTDEQIQKIANTVRAWRGQKEYGEYKDEPGFCKSVTIEDIRKAGYVLTPGRYVGIKPEEDDGIPFDEKMKKLKNELEEYFKQSRELEEKIRENLNLFNF